MDFYEFFKKFKNQDIYVYCTSLEERGDVAKTIEHKANLATKYPNSSKIGDYPLLGWGYEDIVGYRDSCNRKTSSITTNEFFEILNDADYQEDDIASNVLESLI